MIIERLTDLFHLLKKVGDDPSKLLESEAFTSYVRDLDNKSFSEAVFCFGFEVRDLEGYNSYVSELISLLKSEFDKRKEDIGKDLDSLVMYHIGMANLNFYFCKRTGFNTTIVTLDEEEYSDDSFFDIKHSVACLREAITLLSEVLSHANGLLLYQAHRSLDYAWSILENYKVSNSNNPPDLDSSFVWTDQLYRDELWSELVSQMRTKYGLK